MECVIILANFLVNISTTALRGYKPLYFPGGAQVTSNLQHCFFNQESKKHEIYKLQKNKNKAQK